MTTEEFDTFYGFVPWMTADERRARKRQITAIAKANNAIDEDTVDAYAQKYDYPSSEAYEDYKNEAINHLNSK